MTVTIAEKALPGALGGVLLVGFGWHAANERAKRAPQAAALASSTPPVGVIAVPARIERLALEIEALGTA